ncbi:DMR6-like oxygenase 2-like protein [Tanacetum coccineum]
MNSSLARRAFGGTLIFDVMVQVTGQNGLLPILELLLLIGLEYFPHEQPDIASEYVKRTQVIVNELLKGVSENVGFEASYLNKELNLESSFPLLAVNYCPFLLDFDLSRGFMPHTDHGVLTLLYENGVPGLEIFHNGKWVVMSGAPNAFLVLNVNNLEIFSNGVYKSKLHRAVVKDECKRITLVNTNGPSLDTVVGPSPRLVDE